MERLVLVAAELASTASCLVAAPEAGPLMGTLGSFLQAAKVQPLVATGP